MFKMGEKIGSLWNSDPILVGEDGFEPSKLKSNRFTVCPLWPLGNSPRYERFICWQSMELVDGFEPPAC